MFVLSAEEFLLHCRFPDKYQSAALHRIARAKQSHLTDSPESARVAASDLIRLPAPIIIIFVGQFSSAAVDQTLNLTTARVRSSDSHPSDPTLYSYHLNDVKCSAPCYVTRSDGEGKHARRAGSRDFHAP